MSSNAMSLKARIRNIAKQKSISAQVVLQNYMFERFLDRVSRSEYKDKFVLKGGMLITAMVGLDTRTTMDLDATMRDLTLSESIIRSIINDICSIPVDDEVVFSIDRIAQIRPDDYYGGYRVYLLALYDTIRTPLSIDISTGDVITPSAVKYSFTGVLNELVQIELWAYNIETVLAEKIESILSRNVFTTRSRDFYDIYILGTTQKYDNAVLQEAINATAIHRGTVKQIVDRKALKKVITESSELHEIWRKYQNQFPYATNITYEQIMTVLWKLC